MSTHTIYAQDPPSVDAAGQEAGPRASPILLGAVAVATISMGVWWYSQRDVGLADTALPVATAPVESPAADTQPAQVAQVANAPTAATRPAARRSQPTAPARAAVADRAVRPLAGNPLPDYPRLALRNGQEGGVVLNIEVDRNGVPVDVRVVQRSGNRDRGFDRAAIETARQWRFEPAIRDGEAVSSTVQLPVDFSRG